MLRLIRSAGLVLFGLATTAGHAVEPLDFSPVLDKVADGTRVVVVGEFHGTSFNPNFRPMVLRLEPAPDSEN